MAQQVPSFYRRRIGDAVVTVVSDGLLPFDLGVFANIAMEEVHACLAAAFRRMPMQASLNCFLIERDGRTWNEEYE